MPEKETRLVWHNRLSQANLISFLMGEEVPVLRRNWPLAMSELPPPGRNRRRVCLGVWWRLGNLELSHLLISSTSPPSFPHTASLCHQQQMLLPGEVLLIYQYLHGHPPAWAPQPCFQRTLVIRHPGHILPWKRDTILGGGGSGVHQILTHGYWALPGSDLVWFSGEVGD